MSIASFRSRHVLLQNPDPPAAATLRRVIWQTKVLLTFKTVSTAEKYSFWGSLLHYLHPVWLVAERRLLLLFIFLAVDKVQELATTPTDIQCVCNNYMV